MSERRLFVGMGLALALAVGCQVVAHRHRLPAIILLLPAGSIAGTVAIYVLTAVPVTRLLGLAEDDSPDAHTPSTVDDAQRIAERPHQTSASTKAVQRTMSRCTAIIRTGRFHPEQAR